MGGSHIEELLGHIDYWSLGPRNPAEEDAWTKDLAFIDSVMSSLKTSAHDAIHSGAGADVVIPRLTKLRDAIDLKGQLIRDYYNLTPDYGPMPYTLTDGLELLRLRDSVSSHLNNLRRGIPVIPALYGEIEADLDEFKARTGPPVEEWLSAAPARSTEVGGMVDSIGMIGPVGASVVRSLECTVGARLAGRRLASELLSIQGDPVEFDGPVRLVMAYDSGIQGDVGGLNIWRYERARWEALTEGRLVDTDRHTISAIIDGFGVVGVCEDSGSARVDPPERAKGRTFSVSPNPCRGVAQFSWSGWVRPERVSIYDVTGARRWWTPTGEDASVVTWRGTDRAGRRLPAGVYYARLTGEGAPATVRFVLVE